MNPNLRRIVGEDGWGLGVHDFFNKLVRIQMWKISFGAGQVCVCGGGGGGGGGGASDSFWQIGKESKSEKKIEGGSAGR